MSEYPHYDVWISDDSGIILPAEPYAAIKLLYMPDSGRYVVDEIDVCTRGEAIFRYMSWAKRFERCRTLPTCLVVRVSTSSHGVGYHRLNRLPTDDGWTNKIDWYNVVHYLADEFYGMSPNRKDRDDGR